MTFVPGSPAEKAGLKQGDVIIGFGGEKVQSLPSFRLKVATSEVAKSSRDGLPPRRQGTNDVDRARRRRKGRLRHGERRQARQHASRRPANPRRRRSADFGLEVQPLTADLAKPLGLPADLKGLLVSSVKDGSPAEAEGIEEGDVITKVVRDHKPQPLTSVKDFQDLASKTDELAVYVQKGKVGRFVVLSKSAK